ncbi:radical SAM protein [Pasteurella sp. PK-2025]|uniref:radical SAM protein n=1 Tax=Pasteurella sp. PK-2025 TaxID=3413133 RepID=UPI003C77F375
MIDRACISLGERCNLKCAYCHFQNEDNGKLSGLPQEFSSDELIKIIDNIYEYTLEKKLPVFKIGIVGAGETLLQFRKIQTLINYVREKKYSQLQFYTITNGTVFNEHILDFFWRNQDLIKLNISLDGYEELHNIGREKFQRVFNGIKKYEIKFNHKPSINCTVHQETLINRNKLYNFFKKENFKNITFSRLFDSHDKKLVVSAIEFRDFLESFRGSSLNLRQLDENNKRKYDCTMYGNLCGVGRTNIFITKRGIYPCGRFYGHETYNYGEFSLSLNSIERKMEKMKPLNDGECYYDKYVGADNENSNIWRIKIR